MDLDRFLQQVSDAVMGNNRQEDRDYGDRDVRPASEDPYGDPADYGDRDVRPASEDPYGDPADDERVW